MCTADYTRNFDLDQLLHFVPLTAQKVMYWYQAPELLYTPEDYQQELCLTFLELMRDPAMQDKPEPVVYTFAKYRALGQVSHDARRRRCFHTQNLEAREEFFDGEAGTWEEWLPPLSRENPESALIALESQQEARAELIAIFGEDQARQWLDAFMIADNEDKAIDRTNGTVRISTLAHLMGLGASNLWSEYRRCLARYANETAQPDKHPDVTRRAHAHKTKITPEERKQVIDLKRQGKSNPEIAALMGFKRVNTVAVITSRANAYGKTAKTCPVCQTEFVGIHSKVYCSVRCYSKYKRQQKQAARSGH